MIDIHSHVLFGIDDGAKNMEESLAMLRESKKQGVNTVFATPHFYAYEVSFDSYTSKVQSVYETLKCEAASEEYSDIKLGYEVRYFPGIGRSDIKKLCLDRSGFLLLELDFKAIGRSVLTEISELKWSAGITPIIAHAERYYKFKGYDDLLRCFVQKEALCQISAGSLIDGSRYKKAAFKLIKNGMADFIASDMHNMSTRPPLIKQGLMSVARHFGQDAAAGFKNSYLKLYNR